MPELRTRPVVEVTSEVSEVEVTETVYFVDVTSTGLQGVPGVQGPPGLGVVLLEADETEPPPDTPDGTIIYRKLP